MFVEVRSPTNPKKWKNDRNGGRKKDRERFEAQVHTNDKGYLFLRVFAAYIVIDYIHFTKIHLVDRQGKFDIILNGRLYVPPAPAVRSMFYKSIVMLNICFGIVFFNAMWKSPNTRESNNFWLNSLVAYHIQIAVIVMKRNLNHNRQQEKNNNRAINCFHFKFRVRKNSVCCCCCSLCWYPIYAYYLCRSASFIFVSTTKWIISHINESEWWRSRSPR